MLELEQKAQHENVPEKIQPERTVEPLRIYRSDILEPKATNRKGKKYQWSLNKNTVLNEIAKTSHDTSEQRKSNRLSVTGYGPTDKIIADTRKPNHAERTIASTSHSFPIPSTSSSDGNPQRQKNDSFKPSTPMKNTTTQIYSNLIMDELEYGASIGMLPALIFHCVNEIETRGLTEFGLYRISGSDRDVKALKEKFLRNNGIPNLADVDVHVLCGCVKDFLRSQRLIPLALWSLFSNASQTIPSDNEEGSVNKGVYRAIEKLPQPNRDTLAYLIMHFRRISECPDVKMPLTNFAKIFGPTIVGYSCPEPDQLKMFAETQIQFSVMFALLSIPTDYWKKFIILLDQPTRQEERHESNTNDESYTSILPLKSSPIQELSYEVLQKLGLVSQPPVFKGNSGNVVNGRKITIDEGQFIAVCSQFIDFVNSQQAAGKFSSSVEPVERKPDGGMTKNCSTAQGEGRLVSHLKKANHKGAMLKKDRNIAGDSLENLVKKGKRIGPKTFADRARIVSHNSSAYKCPNNGCGKHFGSEYTLERHRTSHSTDRLFKCNLCGANYKVESGLQTHQRKKHKNPAAHHGCNFENCGKLFPTQSKLHQHYKVHKGYRPHRCTICDKSFLNVDQKYKCQRFHKRQKMRMSIE